MNKCKIGKLIQNKVNNFKMVYGEEPENLYLGSSDYEDLCIFIKGSQEKEKSSITTFMRMDIMVLLTPRCVVVCAKKAHDIIKESFLRGM